MTATRPPQPSPQSVGAARSLTDSYRLLQVIGSGSYGQAVLAERLDDGERVVVKQIRFTQMSLKEQEEALQEVHVLATFDHLNVVQYLDCIIEVGPPPPPCPPSRAPELTELTELTEPMACIARCAGQHREHRDGVRRAGRS
jgi:serine/threonine protein kinase